MRRKLTGPFDKFANGLELKGNTTPLWALMRIQSTKAQVTLFSEQVVNSFSKLKSFLICRKSVHLITNGFVRKRDLSNPENFSGFSSTKCQGRNWTSGKDKGLLEVTGGADDTLGGVLFGHVSYCSTSSSALASTCPVLFPLEPYCENR